MTIAGDLQYLLERAKHQDLDGDQMVAIVLDFLTEGNTLGYLLNQGVDVADYCSAIDELRAKILPSETHSV